MTAYSSPRNLANYLSIARQHLSEEKVKEFEAAYRRLHERAAKWDNGLRETIPMDVQASAGGPERLTGSKGFLPCRILSGSVDPSS